MNNGDLEDEFREDALLGRQVAPGETTEGLIYLRDANYEPLDFSLQTPE